MAAKLTPQQVHDWRRNLGLSVDQMAAFVGAAAGRTVRRWEDGTRDIPEYLDILYELSSAPKLREWLIARSIKEWNRRLDEEQAADSGVSAS